MGQAQDTDRQRAARWPCNHLPREVLIDLPAPAPGRAPLPQRIADVLADAIVSRVFRQGHRMPSGAQIAWRFGVSIDTARAAVNLLADRGLVRKLPDRGGAYVRGVEGLGATDQAAHL